MTAVADAPAPPPDPATPRRPSRRMTTSRWIALGLVVVAVAFLVVLATRQSAEQAAAGSPLLGKPAPEVIGPDLDGKTVRLSQLRGRYVVLNFFASWCVPCAREHDDLIRFQEAHAEAGDATVLAVIFDDTVENARAFFDERGGDWPVLADERGKVSLDFGVRGPPESFLISPEGIVLTRIIGEVDFDRLERLVAEAERLRAEARAEAEADS
jgi:cytochrome c biogenesis protein CcmG, thiol:disulfide interchange protein DsbE